MTRAKQPMGVCAPIEIEIPGLEKAHLEYSAHQAIRPDHLQADLDPEKYKVWDAWSKKNGLLRTRLDMAIQSARSRPVTLYLPEKAAACQAVAEFSPATKKNHIKKGLPCKP